MPLSPKSCTPYKGILHNTEQNTRKSILAHLDFLPLENSGVTGRPKVMVDVEAEARSAGSQADHGKPPGGRGSCPVTPRQASWYRQVDFFSFIIMIGKEHIVVI